MKNSNLAFVLIFGVVSVLGQNQFNVIMQAHLACQASSGISQNLVSGALAGNFPNNPVLKRHLLCIHQRLGVQDSNGNVQRDALLQFFERAVPPGMGNRAVFQEVVNRCAVQRNTPENTALELDRCLYQERSAIMG